MPRHRLFQQFELTNRLPVRLLREQLRTPSEITFSLTVH